jgi:putative membrane protein
MFHFKKLQKLKIIIFGTVILVLILLRAYSVSQENKSLSSSNEPVASQSLLFQQSNGQIENLERLFVIDVFQGGMAEIQFGKQALQKSTNPKIKEFAQHMIEQHTKAHKELLQLLNDKKITPLTTLGPKYEAIAAYLMQLSGSSFDEPYMNEMGVNRHLDAIATFQRETALGKDPDFKNFATKGLETARNHFQMAATVTGYTLLSENK